MLCGDHQSPYGDASVTGLTNLLYEVKRLTMHIQPVTCLLRKSSSGVDSHQSLKNSYHLLFLADFRWDSPADLPWIFLIVLD